MPPPEITPEELLLNESFQNWVTGSDPADVQFWEEWIAGHPEHGTTVWEAARMVRLLYAGQKRSVPEEQIDRAIQATTARIQSTRPAPARKPAYPFPFHAPAFRQKAAAVFIGLLLVSAALYWGMRQWADPFTSYQTDAGQTQTILLPDGSRVVLNAHSSLRFATDWQAHATREVWLDGEGYFEVKHLSRPARRFVVHTKGVAVEVLGTTFNVWQREKHTRIVLQTGKVQLKREQQAQPILMEPGEIVELEEGRPQVVRRPVDAHLYTAWKNRQVVFDGTAMTEVASFIEMRYGYRVQFTGKAVGNEKLTYKAVSDDFETLLHILEESFRVQVNNDKKLLIISNM